MLRKFSNYNPHAHFNIDVCFSNTLHIGKITMKLSADPTAIIRKAFEIPRTLHITILINTCKYMLNR